MVINTPFNAIEVQWTTPSDISAQGAAQWNKIRLYRSTSESSGYALIERSDIVPGSVVTFSTNPTNTVNLASHGYSEGDLVSFFSDGTLPSSLTNYTVYYVRNPGAGSFQLSASSNTAILTFATAGTGTIKIYNGLIKSEINSQVSGSWVTNWDDTTYPMTQKDSFYYLVRYYDTTNDVESKYYLTWKSPTPKEARIIQFVRGFVTPWVSQFLTDDDIRGGIVLALNYINIQPPTTNFVLDTYPAIYEPLLYMGAGIFTLMFKYLNVAITDFNYSDNGLSLNVDRGAKVKQAMDNLLGMYTPMVALAKMDFAWGGNSVGTVQLPLSMGGNISRGIMNVLDIFTSVGR
jgi:hypothetical protein